MLLVAEWGRGSQEPFDDENPPIRGIVVWQRVGRVGEGECAWRLAYEIRERFEVATGLRTTLGPPDRPKTEILDGGGAYGFTLEDGDATGDGAMDVLVFQGGWGSGGCGVWRLLARDGPHIRQLFRRQTCDTSVTIRPPGLTVKAAVFREEDSHCCPSSFRRTLLAWTGTGWAPVTIEAVPPEQ